MVRIDTSTVGGWLILAGLVHLLVPESLLRAARYVYDRTLAVELSPDDRTERRIRAVGLLLLAAGTIVPTTRRSFSVSIDRP